MPRYTVNRDQGWPVDSPQYRCDETFESDDPSCQKGVEQGYLILVTPQKPEQKIKRGHAPEPPVPDEVPTN